MTAEPATVGRPGATARPATALDAARFRDLLERVERGIDAGAPPLLTSLLDDPVRRRVMLGLDDQGELRAATWGVSVQAHLGAGQRLDVEGCVAEPGPGGTAAAAAALDALAEWGAGRGCTEMTLDVAADAADLLEAAAAADLERRADFVRLARVLEPPPVQVPVTTPVEADEWLPGLDLEPEPLPPPRWWLHGTLMALGIASIALTDPWSGDPVRGGLLLLVDAAFVIYVFGFAAWLRYRRQTTRPGGL